MKDFDQLLNQHLEGTLSPEEFGDLQEQLRSSSANRDAFYATLAMDQHLAKTYQAHGFDAIHARAVKVTWAETRQRVTLWRRSLLAAAAIIAVAAIVASLLQTKSVRYALTTSGDAVFFIGDGESSGTFIKTGATLAVHRGVVKIELNRHTQAIVEGPAELKVLDPSGNIELRTGRALFTVKTGGQGLMVHTPNLTLRDIGTTFGVLVEGGKEQVHVLDGLVEILKEDKRLALVRAGEAKGYAAGSLNSLPLDSEQFMESLPATSVLLSDDFSDPDGTSLAGKRTDIGGRWVLLQGERPFEVQKGVLDTSHSSKAMTVGFESAAPEGPVVYILNFRTVSPKMNDPDRYRGGIERISLAQEGLPQVGVAARGLQNHCWFIEREEENEGQLVTGISAFDNKEITLIYDMATGIAELFHRTEDQLHLLSQRQLEPDLHFNSLLIANPETHGDVALEHVTVKAVHYSRH